LVCGYVSARRRALGDTWYDGWVASQIERDPKPLALFFEVAWRCGATESVASMVAEMLRSEKVSPHLVAQLAFGRWGENLAVGVLEKVLRAMADTGHRETAIGILAHRMKSNSEEAERWEPLALELVTASDLVRSGQMTSHYWKEVANTLVADHSGEIAVAILREQADRESGIWFAEHSEAAGVLKACVEKNPSGVWQAMKPYLSSLIGASRFSIGFPQGVLERMPLGEVRPWIAERPEERATMIAKLTTMNMSSDETLASQLLNEYADNERIASAFFSAYMSGSWWGPASSHWDQLAEALDAVADRTTLPKLRRWASNHARSLREMAERDRQREEEEELRGP
jgi:hypothetical protein